MGRSATCACSRAWDRGSISAPSTGWGSGGSIRRAGMYAGVCHGRNRRRVQAAVVTVQMPMDVVLVSITALSLVLAIAMGVVLFTVLREDRQRSDARVAALAAASARFD